MIKKLLLGDSRKQDIDYILDKLRNSSKYSVCKEQHIQLIHDSLISHDKGVYYDKLCCALVTPLMSVGALKYLVLIHELLYLIQEEMSGLIVQNRLQNGVENQVTKLAIAYYNFIYSLCCEYESFRYVLIHIDDGSIDQFMLLNLDVQITHLSKLSILIQQLNSIVKIWDAQPESPLIEQIGGCIIKDFTVIYNFLSLVMNVQQRQIIKLTTEMSRQLYRVYQIVIQMTHSIRKLHKLKQCIHLKEPTYFVVVGDLNKKIELYMQSFWLTI